MLISDLPPAAGFSSANLSILKIEQASQSIQYQLQILNRRILPGLVPCHLKKQNGQKLIWHDISRLTALPEYLCQCDLNPSDGESLINEICEIICRSARYLLPPSQFRLSVDHVYISKTAGSSSPIWTNYTGAVHLMFWPVYMGEPEISDEPLNQTDVRQFADEESHMLINTLSQLICDICGMFDIDQTRQEQLIRILHEKGISGLETTARLELELENRAEAQPVQAAKQNDAKRPASFLSSGLQHALNVGSCSGSQRIKSALVILLHLLLIGSAAAIFTKLFNPEPVFRSLILAALLLLLFWHLLLLFSPITKMKTSLTGEQINHWLTQFRQQIRIMNRPREQYNKTKPVDRMQQTLIIPSDPASFRIATLTENPPGTPAEKDGLRVFILVEQFIIGRDHNKTDLCLAESAIGRQHARISRKGGSFFICDLGSKNGTRLNDQLLEKYQDTILPESCRLQFANHQFFFKAED